MTDDIVTRLREEAQTFWDVRRFRPLWIEAADEIERLRAELAMAQKWRDNFKLAFEKERKKTEYWHEQAVSND